MAANREISSLSAQLSTLLNRQLMQICQANGLSKNGVKAELQRRIVNALTETIHSAPDKYVEIRSSIQSMGGGNRNNYHQYGAGSSPSSSTKASTLHNNINLPGIPKTPGLHRPNGYSHASGTVYKPGSSGHGSEIRFRHSPFYAQETMIGAVRTLEAQPQHRNTVTISLRVNDFPALNQCAYNKSMRVMVFCGGDEEPGGFRDISFPHQSELKVNGGDVKANLRGLKNKPGSTRPVDITEHLRLDKTAYTNNVEFTYALTTKVNKPGQILANQRFLLTMYVCKTTSVDELAARIQTRKISKAMVIQELTKSAYDPDIEATSQVLSLKCPLSYMRLKVPCRSVMCTHVQCFDATSYLQLQEQGPQWLCPICSKSAPFERLAMDEYVRDILDRTSDSTEQVTIEPNGAWRTETGGEPLAKKPRYSNTPADSLRIDDDDDVVPLDSYGAPSSRKTQTPSQSMLGTPVSMSMNGGSGSASKKRPAAEVIDLTLSDSDDEPLTRPTKRQNTGPPSNLLGLTFPDYSSY